MADRLEHALSDDHHDRIFQKRVLPDYFNTVDDRPRKPTAIILGGQPGAGKPRLLHDMSIPCPDRLD